MAQYSDDISDIKHDVSEISKLSDCKRPKPSVSEISMGVIEKSLSASDCDFKSVKRKQSSIAR